MKILRNFFVWFLYRNTVLSRYGTTAGEVYKTVLEKIRETAAREGWHNPTSLFNERSDFLREKIKKMGFRICKDDEIINYLGIDNQEVVIVVGMRLYLNITSESFMSEKRHASLYKYTGKRIPRAAFGFGRPDGTLHQKETVFTGHSNPLFLYRIESS